MNPCMILHVLIVLISSTSSLPVKSDDLKKVHAGRIPSKPRTHSQKTGESIDDIPDELRDLKDEHKVLYVRARNGDYDFAKFGQDCQILSLEEMETFLKLMDENIGVGLSDERDIRERISPEEKGSRLERLFNHSKTICDYRNLLTCHKNHRTCACAHPSMGLNRVGICGVNIGHVCEFPERTLEKYGILLTPQTSPIKCLLENAECVLESTADLFGASVSPIRKICKCQKGFWGATCRKRAEDKAGNYLQNTPQQQTGIGPFKPKVKKEDKESTGPGPGTGRGFWGQESGTLIADIKEMHPEEIKERLVKMMNEQEMYPSVEREGRAQDLVKSLEQDFDKEEMVINELHLRDLATLNLGDVCEPERQIILDNPPVAKNGQRWIDPNPEDIKSWQLGLLQDNKPFCNIYNHFRCDATTHVCQCKAGLVPDPLSKGKACVIPLGFNCGPDFDPILEFDPFKDRKRFSESLAPNCIYKTECKEQSLFFEKKCWCKAGEICEGNFNTDTFHSQVKGIKSRFILGLGDSCDPKIHQQLLSYGNSFDPGFQKRTSLFKEVLDNPENRLCDIGNYLNCSETSRTCQCWKQLRPNKNPQTEDENQCVSMNMAPCGKTFEYGKYMYEEGSQLWQVGKAFSTLFRPQCIPEAKCAGGDDLEWAGRCICHDSSKTGEMCDEKKAVLASSFRARQIPNSDDDETPMIRVYFDLNQQTNLLEQLMTLQLNQQCDPDVGLKVDRVVKFWREIGSWDDATKEKRSLKHFVAMTKWTKYLVNTVQGNSAALCIVTRGLRCHRTTGACGCARGTRWVGDRCYVDVDEPCDPRPGADWIPTCIKGTKCLSLRRTSYGSYRCTPCPEGKKECTGNENDDRPYDTWDGYGDHVVQGRSRGSAADDEGFEVLPPPPPDGKKNANATEDKSFSRGIIVEESAADNGEEDKKYIALRRTLQHPKDIHPRSSLEDVLAINPPKSEMDDVKVPEPRTILDPSSSVGGNSAASDETLSHRQKQTYLDEIDRMLKEILLNRTIPTGQKCNRREELQLTEIFPRLPLYDIRHLLTSIPYAYSSLSKLYWQGISFCDRKHYLSCSIDGICGCSPAFGLVQEGGECRLKQDKYCSISKDQEVIDMQHTAITRNKKAAPAFKCRRGTKCTKVDHGLPVCVRTGAGSVGEHKKSSSRKEKTPDLRTKEGRLQGRSALGRMMFDDNGTIVVDDAKANNPSSTEEFSDYEEENTEVVGMDINSGSLMIIDSLQIIIVILALHSLEYFGVLNSCK